MADCVFCKIIDGTYTNSNIYEDEDIIAFMDIQPVNTGHILVVPKNTLSLYRTWMMKPPQKCLQLQRE